MVESSMLSLAEPEIVVKSYKLIGLTMQPNLQVKYKECNIKTQKTLKIKCYVCTKVGQDSNQYLYERIYPKQ